MSYANMIVRCFLNTNLSYIKFRFIENLQFKLISLQQTQSIDLNRGKFMMLSDLTKAQLGPELNSQDYICRSILDQKATELK